MEQHPRPLLCCRAVIAQAFAELTQRESRAFKRLPNIVHYVVCIHGFLVLQIA